MDKLQLFSFGIRKDDIDDVNLYVYKVPVCLKKLFDRVTNRNFTRTTIFKIAVTCFNEVLYANGEIKDIKYDDDIWFYSVKPIDIEALRARTIEWIKFEYLDKCNEELIYDFADNWGNSEIMNLRELFGKSSIYKVLPCYYIYKLSKDVFQFDSLSKKLKFSRIISDDSGATMMTRPFYARKKTKDKSGFEISEMKFEQEKEYYVLDPFSYYVKCNLTQPIDYMNGYVLNFSLHIRIWESRALLTDDKSFFSSKESTGVFIYKESDYYDFEDKIYNKIDIEWSKDLPKYKYKKNSDKYYVNLININLSEAFKMSNDAERNLSDGECVLISKKNSMSGRTKRGAGLPERNELWDILTKKLSNLKPRASLSKIQDIKFGTLIEYKKLLEELDENEIEHFSFSKSTKFNKHAFDNNMSYTIIRFYIATDKTIMYQKSIQLLKLLLRLQAGENNRYKFKEGTDVEIIQVENSYCKTVDNSQIRGNSIKAIKEIYGHSENKVLKLALIDMKDYSKLTADTTGEIIADEGNKTNKKKKISISREQDPKSMIRSNCKDCKVITQFIDYELKKKNDEDDGTSALDSKLLNSLKDLLMAGGFFEQSTYMKNEKKGFELIKNNECLVGIGKISDNNNSNILCMSLIENGVIKLNIYGWGKWYSLEEAIFAINSKTISSSKININGNYNLVKSSIAEWIQRNLDEITKKYDRVYCFVDAAVRNRLWEWGKNGKFMNITEKYRLADIDKVVFVRVNSSNDEVPDYYIDKGTNKANRNSGIFKSNDDGHTYYLVPRRAPMSQPGTEYTKLMRPDTRIPRQRMLEINIQGCLDEEEQNKIAALTQILRGINITYNSDTAEPLPLFCMKRMTEYYVAEGEK